MIDMDECGLKIENGNPSLGKCVLGNVVILRGHTTERGSSTS